MDDVQNRLRAARRWLLQRLEGLERAGVEQIQKAGVPPVRPAADRTTGELPPGVEPVQAANRISTRTGQRPVPRGTGVSPVHQETPRGTGVSPVHQETPRGTGVSPVQQQTPRHDMSHQTPAAASLLSVINQPYPTDLPIAAADRQRLLDRLNADIRACTLCRELACTRKQTVFGVGNPRPRVVFFGEAPGADEDRLGEPFVGRAGQLLTKIIEACGWQRSDVYIMNTLKCRPPENRTPLPDEVANCRSFFERQFELLRPEYIVCAGAVAAQALLETTESVGKLRGRFYNYRDSKVVVTYHPSYLLRNPGAKRHVWDDMQMLLKEMGLPIPTRGAN
jgi:DNA polymerase